MWLRCVPHWKKTIHKNYSLVLTLDEEVKCMFVRRETGVGGVTMAGQIQLELGWITRRCMLWPQETMRVRLHTRTRMSY